MFVDGVVAMPVLAVDIELIIEISLLAFVLILAIVIASIFIFRDLKKSYKEVWKQQSKFDIELRKTYNLVSKLVRDPVFDKYREAVVKDLSHDEKKELLLLVDSAYASIDATDPDNRYVVETFLNLQEIRVSLDAKALSYNKKISFFPFNLFSKVFHMTKLQHYTPHQ
ncbi:MAG: hypothetical protein Q8N15_02565 [Bacillota bacterium]|nr:hypothetical protein [Bacillota bacterium]